MANVKISGLTAAGSVAGANEFEINEAGTSKKVTGTQIATFVFSGNEITMPGTGSLTLPKGNDGARPGSPTAGMIRYNTTSGGFEGYTVIGFDPAMGRGHAAFVAMTYNRIDGKMYVLDCENMSEPTPQKIRAMIEEFTLKYSPNEFRVEINAHQKAYELDTDLRQWLSQYGCSLKPHFTQKNKWDTSHGVASMSTMLGTMHDGTFQKNNTIEFPSSDGSEGVKALIQAERFFTTSAVVVVIFRYPSLL